MRRCVRMMYSARVAVVGLANPVVPVMDVIAQLSRFAAAVAIAAGPNRAARFCMV